MLRQTLQGLSRTLSNASPREGMLRGLEERLGLRGSSSGGFRGPGYESSPGKQRGSGRSGGERLGGRTRSGGANLGGLERLASGGAEHRQYRTHHSSGE